VVVAFTAINGSKQEISPESGEIIFEGDLRPNGEWMLVDKCVGLSLVNRFDPSEVSKCLVHWGTGDVNKVFWSRVVTALTGTLCFKRRTRLCSTTLNVFALLSFGTKCEMSNILALDSFFNKLISSNSF